MSSEERNKTIVLNAAKSFGDPKARADYLAMYGDNATIYGAPPGSSLTGKEAIRQYYEGFWAAFPDARLELDNIIEEGDKIACTFTVTGKHTGSPFNGIPANGKSIKIEGVSILRFESGKCIERWHGADTLPVLQQLGAMPASMA